ncbi:unnamed protein product [Cylindrotheca closterium]|uniref:Kinesin light chain n=1 Tax=Cylindrotheca closterium TaxID=2856 RepID=A0AAD2JPT1_9STRA|nr:unnamed protein product [Cylindrotheca closterium]
MEGNKRRLVEELMKKSHYFYRQRNYQKTKETLETVLEMKTEDLGEDDLEVAETLYQLGGVLRTEGNFSEALEKLKRALAIRVAKLGENHADIADTYRAIGSILYEEQENYEEAEKMYRKVLDIKLKILPNDHFDVTDLYMHLGYLLTKQGKFSEATKIQKLQLATLLEKHGEDYPNVVLVYDGIAELLILQNRLDDALQMLERGIEICNRLQPLGDHNMDILARTLLEKANILDKQGNFEAAAETFNKVVRIQVETVGEMHPEIAGTYEALARAYIQQDMPESAIEPYMKAFRIHRKELGNDHAHTKELAVCLEVLEHQKNAIALNEQGLSMKAEGDLERAMKLFEEALDMHKEVSIVSFTIVSVYENIAAVKVDQGLLEDAIAASAEALKIRRRKHGDDHADTKRRMEAHRSLLRRLLETRS